MRVTALVRTLRSAGIAVGLGLFLCGFKRCESPAYCPPMSEIKAAVDMYLYNEERATMPEEPGDSVGRLLLGRRIG